jgi:spectinomycin phosphotransferase
MLEKPDLDDRLIAARLQDEYGLQVARVTFLPLGVDVDAAVYRVVTDDDTAYFLKLRRGAFDGMTVAVPRFLSSCGIDAVIAPLATRDGRLWGRVGAYRTILYPFICSRNGYEVTLSDQQWVALGAALKRVHTVPLPEALARLIPREDYSPRWRDSVMEFQDRVENTAFADPVSAGMAALLQARRGVIARMVARAEELARDLRARSLPFVLCHSDVHPANLLIGEGGSLYIVDWDSPILAPKERDLMFAGAGMGNGLPGGREEALFYQGYGRTEVERAALAYYRYERIVEDIAAFCEQVFLEAGDGADRAQAVAYTAGQFLPDHEVEVALATDDLVHNSPSFTAENAEHAGDF